MWLSVLLMALVSTPGSILQDSSVRQLRELAVSEDKERFEAIVRFIEQSKSKEEAKVGMDIFEAASEAHHKRASKLFPGTLVTDEIRQRYWEYMDQMAPHQSLLGIGKDGAAEFVRALYRTTGSDRVQMIKSLAKDAGEDWTLKNDEYYLGPTCGSYDHTPEDKVAWAVQRYRQDAIQALRQPGWSGRFELMVALRKDGRTKPEAALKEIFLKLSHDPNTLVRGEAILSLEAFPGEATEGVVLEGLDNVAADTRIKCLIVAFTQSINAAEPKAIKLADDRVPRVRSYAYRLLGSFATPEAKWKLIECLKDDECLHDLLNAMRQANQTDAVPYLVAMLAKVSPSSQSQMLRALADLDLVSAEPEILRALNSKDEDLLQSMVSLAGEMKLKTARARVQELTRHSDKYIRESAFECLRKIDGG